MELFSEVKEYIENGQEFDETLALRIIEYQAQHITFYGEFLKRTTGKTKFFKISEVPPLPVEFFKTRRLFTLNEHTGYFESSGTTGNKSKVFYNEKSLTLYKLSSIKAYPLKNRRVKTLIDLSKKRTSSLAFMVNHLIESYGGYQIKNIYEEVENDDVLFLTAIQLYDFVKKSTRPFLKCISIIETGGYKKLSEKYNRHQLYGIAKRIFPNATFFTEYGMTELFSQFYADEVNPFKEHHFLKVMEHKDGYLKVFDFANLFQISYLFVPDIIHWIDNGFEYVRRDTKDEERGCSYTFG